MYFPHCVDVKDGSDIGGDFPAVFPTLCGCKIFKPMTIDKCYEYFPRCVDVKMAVSYFNQASYVFPTLCGCKSNSGNVQKQRDVFPTLCGCKTWFCYERNCHYVFLTLCGIKIQMRANGRRELNI